MHRFRIALMVALIASACWSAAAMPASASTHQYKLDQTQPRIMAAASAQAAAPYSGPSLAPGTTIAPPLPGARAATLITKPQREVFGFVNAGNLGSSSSGYTTWNYNLLTTVAYFGLQVNSGDGNLVTTNTGWAVLVSSTFTNFVRLAHANGVRVILSLNLHDYSTSPTSQICNGLAPSSRQNTISMALGVAQNVRADGININYEGNIAACANGQTNRDELVALAREFRAAMPAGMYMAIDTYSGSAEDNLEFFNVTGLAPYVDSFFVMAYDMDFANYAEAPLGCSRYCFNPISPLNTYRFNTTKSMAQYTALVPASKVILGQPLYGRRGCVPSLTAAHQYPIPGTNFVSPTYGYASTIPSQTGVYRFAAHRDPGDGVSEWDTWYDSDWACNREQYFDDTYSLAAKFNLINVDNLRGVGLFELDYAGGALELWSTISTYFSCPVTINLPATESTSEFGLPLTAGCSVAYFEAQVFDNTLNQGWDALSPIAASGGSATGVADGYAGHEYQFRVRSHSTAGLVSSWTYATTTIDPSATASLPFKGLYTLDPYGGVHLDNSGPLSSSVYWPGWKIARSAKALPGADAPQSGFVLDGWGGLHPYGAPGLTETSDSAGHYWKGWDIARDFAFLPSGTGGYVLDGYGGLHPFAVNGGALPPATHGAPYWGGFDIARKVVIFADGTGGYILDGYGGVHEFGVGAAGTANPHVSGYWGGWDIARDMVLIPGTNNGYVMDGYGGLHPFAPSGQAMPPVLANMPYWPGWTIARGVWLLPGSANAGYILDGWGGLHPFGGAPTIVNFPYWPGKDIAKTTWGA